MSALLLRPAVLLSLVLALPIWFLRPQPAADPRIDAFFDSLDGCAAPCFMNIRPGETEFEHAMWILRTNPWVETYGIEHFTPTGPGFGSGSVIWTWSGQQPEIIDSRYEGRFDYVEVRGDTRVSMLTIHTHLPTALVQEWFGTPLRSRVRMRGPSHLSIGSEFEVPDRSTIIGVSTLMRCPATPLDYWYSQAEISIIPLDDVLAAPLDFRSAFSAC